MGVLTKRVLGSVSGKVGDIQFRLRGNDNYIAMNPASFIPGTDEASVARREKFGLTVKFSSAINSIEPLRQLWEPETPSGTSPFNYMTKVNYPYVSGGVIDGRAMITPDLGFAISATTLDLTAAQLSAVIDTLGADAGIDDIVERDISLAAVVHLSSPVNADDKPYEFISLLSPAQSVDILNPLTFNIPLDSIETQVFDAYQTVKIFVALFTADADGVPVRFSTTLAG